MMRKILAAFAAAGAATLLAACGSTADPVSAPATAPPVAAGEVVTPLPVGCAWDGFEATVRSGPHAGAALRGQLVVAAHDGAVQGHLFPAGDPLTGVPVSGSLDGGDLTLAFTTDLGVFDGTGVVGGGMCQEGLEGPLTGPAAGDEGDWIGVGVVDYTQTPEPVLLEPGAVVEDNDTQTNPSPKCIQVTRQNGEVLIRCTNGTVTCVTTYPPNGGKADTACFDPTKPQTRPGLEN